MNEKIKQYVGKAALLNAGTVNEAKGSITDVRERYGNVDVYFVNVSSGKGAWKQIDGVKIL